MFGQSASKHGDSSGASNGGQPDFTAAVNDLTTPAPATPAPAPNGPPTQAWGHPVGPSPGSKVFTPTNNGHPEPVEPSEVPQPRHTPPPAIGSHSEPPATPLPQPQPTPPVPSGSVLVDIKQKALGQLSPLVQHLDQSPEEKFQTIMMMIQASDDQDLIKTAYEVAATIPDEKIRAQALLDIVNEINYFTQSQQLGN